MKRIIIICLITLLLGGCGSNSNMSTLDIEGASRVLDKKITKMIDMEADELSVVYGLDVSLLDKYKIKCSQLMNGNFYAIMKVNDKNRDKVTQQMSNLFDVLESQSNLYSPEAVKLIKNHLETSVGNYLIYIVSKDNEKMYESIKGYIK